MWLFTCRVASQAKDGGLGAELATIPRKNSHAVETLADQQDAGGKIEASQKLDLRRNIATP